MNRLLYIALIVCSLLCACTPNNTPVKPVNPDSFDYGFVTRYGAFYDGLENNVYMLDIYSPGLRLNREGYMEGSGLNLCLSDVFTLPTDSLLQEGVVYRTDSTGAADTFLPGQNYDGNINGAYLLDIQDSQINAITLFREGTFELTRQGDTTRIDLHLVTEAGKKYEAVFRATLRYKTHKTKSVPRP